jgi:VanZ family protein
MRFSSGVIHCLTFFKNWWLVLGWMVMIFTASADSDSFRHSSIYFEPFVRWLFPQLSAEHVGLLHHLFRKTCHLTEYAILAVLCRDAIRASTKNIFPAWRWDEAGFALAITFAYAASDELHQVFVATRTAQVSDVMVDTTGGALGLLLLWLGKKICHAEK